ncbi:unnamed protein product, partial [Brenthis ino]
MASLNDEQICAILFIVVDEGDTDPQDDLESDVEDILEADSEQPTDDSIDSDDEPHRTSNILYRRRIISSDSSDIRCVLFEFEYLAKYRRLKSKSALNFKVVNKVSCRPRHCSAVISVPVLELCLSCEHVPTQTKCQSYVYNIMAP